MPKYVEEYEKVYEHMKAENESIQALKELKESDLIDYQRKTKCFKNLDDQIECQREYLELGLKRLIQFFTIRKYYIELWGHYSLDIIIDQIQKIWSVKNSDMSSYNKIIGFRRMVSFKCRINTEWS